MCYTGTVNDTTMTIYDYSILINLDPDKYFQTPEESFGASHVQTWQGQIEAESVAQACEAIFARHNRDDRPDGQVGPSLSVGDVVHLQVWGYHIVARFGFEELDYAPVVVPGTWSETVGR